MMLMSTDCSVHKKTDGLDPYGDWEFYAMLRGRMSGVYLICLDGDMP